MPGDVVSKVMYLSIPVDSADQGASLANYLNAHGVTEAVADGPDQVVIPLGMTSVCRRIVQLHKSWGLFWEHSESSLYGLPVYVKSGPECERCT